MEYSIIKEGQVLTERLNEAILARLAHLDYGHSQYFNATEDTVLVNLHLLVCQRAREKGVVNASTLMRQAADGLVGKRQPISILKLDNGLMLVVDGNSTVLNAMFSQWPDIPCIISKDPMSRMEANDQPD